MMKWIMKSLFVFLGTLVLFSASPVAPALVETAHITFEVA